MQKEIRSRADGCPSCPDKKKTYCFYEAPNADAIRDAAARLGIPADVIVEVEQFGPVPVQ